MYSHVMVGANDLDASRKFYDATFGALGAEPGIDVQGRILYMLKGNVFMVSKPLNGKAAECGNGWTVAFAVDSPEEAKAWHDAGVANGGTSIEDPPGPRDQMGVYLAYLRDPAGNKLGALHVLGGGLLDEVHDMTGADHT